MLDPKCIYRKSIFAKCAWLACLLSFSSLFISTITKWPKINDKIWGFAQINFYTPLPIQTCQERWTLGFYTWFQSKLFEIKIKQRRHSVVLSWSAINKKVGILWPIGTVTITVRWSCSQAGQRYPSRPDI